MIYDIAVIGGGPAGATFAGMAADGGKSMVLINGQDIRGKKPCGGLLAPDTQKALAHLDLVLPGSVLADPQIFSVKTVDVCKKTVCYYPRHYINVDRAAFDKWLLSLVPESVDKISGVCLNIVRENEYFTLTVRTIGGENTVRAKNIIGADGASSIVRRTFYDDKIYHYTAIQQWFKTTAKAKPFYSCVFDPETSESCSWSIFKDGYFIFGGCFKPQNCRAAFEKQKERLKGFEGFDFENCVKTEACMALRPRKMSDFITGNNGVYLIGEAAGFISPSSFEGISYAIKTGHILAEIFKSGNENIGGEYASAVKSIKIKLMLKTAKRWVMYTPFVRNIIMKTGVGSIEIWR